MQTRIPTKCLDEKKNASQQQNYINVCICTFIYSSQLDVLIAVEDTLTHSIRQALGFQLYADRLFLFDNIKFH